MDLSKFERIDWDDEDDEDGNLVHCLAHGVDEQVVDEVLREEPVEVGIPLNTAEFAIVGPNAERNQMWTLLFDVSWKRGDWLRPITGWPSKAAEIREWELTRKKKWKGKR